MSGVPEAGQTFNVVESERIAKEIIDHRLAGQRKRPDDAMPSFTLDEFFERMEGGGIKELAVVIKGDVHGSVEAVRDSLLKQSRDAVKVNVERKARPLGNASDWSDATGTFTSFKVDTVDPTQPTFGSPAHQARQADGIIALSWGAITEANGYEFENAFDLEIGDPP